MRNLDTLLELWAAWCARENQICRDAMEMACDGSLPHYVQNMARDFVLLWESVDNANP
jgi:hypothetical protein